MMLNVKHCRQNKQKAAILVDGMWENEFLDGEAQGCMINRVRSALSPEGGDNLAGIEVLRCVDDTVT